MDPTRADLIHCIGQHQPDTPSAGTSNARGRWLHLGLDSEHRAASPGPAASHVTHSSEVQCDRW
jgi:hypothetical protein